MGSGSYWDEEARAVITVCASGKSFSAPTRVQRNLLARSERELLDYLCKIIPARVTPDHLTILGSAGAAVATVGYALSNWRSGFFLLAIFGIFLNWAGDSLDGSLARYRRIERPRYGYCLDHMINSFNFSMLFFGLGLAPDVKIDAALFAALGCQLITSQVLIANHVEGRFHHGFIGFGPTELRLIMVIMTLTMLFHDPIYVTMLNASVSTHTIFLWMLGTIFVGIAIYDFTSLMRRLAVADPRPAQATFAAAASYERRSVPLTQGLGRR